MNILTINVENNCKSKVWKELHDNPAINHLRLKFVKTVIDDDVIMDIVTNPYLKRLDFCNIHAVSVLKLINAMAEHKSTIVYLYLDVFVQTVKTIQIFDKLPKTNVNCISMYVKDMLFSTREYEIFYDSFFESVVKSPNLTNVTLTTSSGIYIHQNTVSRFADQLPNSNLERLKISFYYSNVDLSPIYSKVKESKLVCFDVKGLCKAPKEPVEFGAMIKRSKLKVFGMEITRLSFDEIRDILTACFYEQSVVEEVYLYGFEFKDSDTHSEKLFLLVELLLLNNVRVHACEIKHIDFFNIHLGTINGVIKTYLPSMKTKQALLTLGRVFQSPGLSQHVGTQIIQLIHGE